MTLIAVLLVLRRCTAAVVASCSRVRKRQVSSLYCQQQQQQSKGMRKRAPFVIARLLSCALVLPEASFYLLRRRRLLGSSWHSSLCVGGLTRVKNVYRNSNSKNNLLFLTNKLQDSFELLNHQRRRASERVDEEEDRKLVAPHSLPSYQHHLVNNVV